MNATRKLELTETGTHERELTVTLNSEQVSKEFNKTLNKVQQSASRPGFRPGKMPKHMVMSFYGDRIKQSLIETLIEQSFSDACKEKDLIPVSKPQMEPLGEVSQDKDFTYRAIFQVKPKVDVPDFKGLSFEVREFTFDETDVEDELKSLQESYATFVEQSDRTEIGEHDLVQCHSVLKIDGEINTNYSHDDYAVPLFADNVPADLRAALVGKKVSDVATVKYTLPSEHQDEAIRGKDCELVLTIKSFKERVLPKLDDEFAKDLSDKFQSLDDIKESIRLRFNITAKRRNEYYKQDAITKALIDKNPLDVPSALVERMALTLINRELEAVAEKDREGLVKNHWQEMWQSVQDRALFRVKAELLFEALIASLDITASADEIAQKFNRVKNVNKEDASYSIQVEKLLDIIAGEASISIISEPLFTKGA